jgi:hypothetical protein
VEAKEEELRKCKSSNLMMYVKSGTQASTVDNALRALPWGPRHFVLQQLPSANGTTPYKVVFGRQEDRRQMLQNQGELQRARPGWRLDLDLTSSQLRARKAHDVLVTACRRLGARVEWRGVDPYVQRRPAAEWLQRRETRHAPRGAAASPPPPPAPAPAAARPEGDRGSGRGRGARGGWGGRGGRGGRGRTGGIQGAPVQPVGSAAAPATAGERAPAASQAAAGGPNRGQPGGQGAAPRAGGGVPAGPGPFPPPPLEARPSTA